MGAKQQGHILFLDHGRYIKRWPVIRCDGNFQVVDLQTQWFVISYQPHNLTLGYRSTIV